MIVIVARCMVKINTPKLTIILLAHNPHLSWAYPMIIYAHAITGNLPIQNLVAKQWPTNSLVPKIQPSHEERSGDY